MLQIQFSIWWHYVLYLPVFIGFQQHKYSHITDILMTCIVLKVVSTIIYKLRETITNKIEICCNISSHLFACTEKQSPHISELCSVSVPSCCSRTVLYSHAELLPLACSCCGGHGAVFHAICLMSLSRADQRHFLKCPSYDHRPLSFGGRSW